MFSLVSVCPGGWVCLLVGWVYLVPCPYWGAIMPGTRSLPGGGYTRGEAGILGGQVYQGVGIPGIRAPRILTPSDGH